MSRVPELCALELAFVLHQKENMTVKDIKEYMSQHNVDLPKTFDINNLPKLSSRGVASVLSTI